MNLKINLFKSVFSIALLYPFILVNAENYTAPIIQPGAPGNPSKIQYLYICLMEGPAKFYPELF